MLSATLVIEVQEVAVYRSSLSHDLIVDNMFRDQPDLPELKGYFKFAYSTNSANRLRNYASATSNSIPAATVVGSVLFEETNQAGVQSAFDARKNGGRDALTPLSGGFSWQQVAFSRPTPGIAFDLRFGYSSGNAFGGFKLGGIDPYAAGALGGGWRHTFETRVIPAGTFSPLDDTGTVGLLHWSGAIDTWDRKDSESAEYQPRDREYKGELLSLPNGNLQWTTPERLRYLYKSPGSGLAVLRGRLLEIRDLNGNVVSLKYNETTGILTNVVDTARGTNALQYNARNLLTKVTFNSWQVNFDYDSSNRLSAKWITNTAPAAAGITAPNVNTRWEFHYGTNGLLSEIVDPRGNTNLSVFYDQYGRQTTQVDALLRTNRTEYGLPGKRQITHIDPGGFSWIETYDRKGRILAQQDPLTNITRYTYDDRGNRTSITEPFGWQTFLGYDERANVIARTNALGEITTWWFHPFFNKAVAQVTPQPTNVNGNPTWTNRYIYDDATGNLLRHEDDLGPLVTYRYETNGLVLASTNANGFVTSFGYDTNGFLNSRTEPFTANSTVTTTYVVNDVGWKRRETNPLGDPTSYDLDLNGNPVRVQDVLGRAYHRTYDANGNLLSTTDGKGQLTTFAYDTANQRTNITDRTRTNVWSTTYTPRGKPDRVTDPLGNAVVSAYDGANRLVRVTDPLGGSTINQYDANGNSVAQLDKLGRRWTKTYDRLNRVGAEADPLGNARRTSYDVAGRILQTTTPNGHPTLHSYDGRGRLTLWQDAEGYEWRYTYDGVGNITDIEDAGEPIHGHYVMTYGPRNERTMERNQDNFEWRYEYDELLRLRAQRDPNGTTRTPTYDAAGRLLFVDFSTGRRDTFGPPDANDNLPLISRRFAGVNPSTRFVYDSQDRPIGQTDAHGDVVGYGYDPLGRVTTLTYPGGKTLTSRHDALGRLTNQVDWAGREMTYDYDRADRLVRRTWPNGVVQTNAFDEAGRLTALSHSPLNSQPSTINLALTYAYDRNGNKTGSTEKGTLRWRQPPLTDETSTFTASGRLKTRAINDLSTNHSPTLNWTCAYDAGGNMTNALLGGGSGSSGQNWALTYDEDNRTTSLDWTTNGVTHKVQNRYDALGRRVARTMDSTNTGYVLSLKGGMERILCDLDGGGAVTAWYVHGPDLCYRVDVADNVVCYHADAQANVIALTGAGGTNLVQFAYTPYGRVLGTTNYPPSTTPAPQPYLFVGSQGVMEEFPGLYFMRARYYSADAGIFLSTDPVKKIGPGWKSVAYAYADDNPMAAFDPKGETPAHLTAFAIGMLAGATEGVFEGAIEDQLSGLPVAFGMPESAAQDVTQASFEYLSAGQTALKTYRYARTVAAAGDPSRMVAAYTLGEVAGGIAGKGIYKLSRKLREGYLGAINLAGSAIGGVLYDQFGVGAVPQPNSSMPAANKSLANRTATVADPKGAATTAATSTSPGASGRGTSSSGGGGGNTITIQSGATLSGIARDNGTTVSALMAANPQVSSPDKIYAGANLNVPGGNTGNFGGFGGGSSRGRGASGRWP